MCHLLLFSLFRSLSLLAFLRLLKFLHWINSDNVDTHLPEHQILVLNSFKKLLFILFPPFLSFFSFSIPTMLFLTLLFCDCFLTRRFTLFLRILFFIWVFLRFKLMPVVNLHAFVNYLAELLNLFNWLLISFFHFFHYLQRPMFLTEHSVTLLSISFLYFHAIVIPSCAFNMKGYCTSRGLTLHTSSYLLQTYYTLKMKAFLIKFVESYWSFWCN